MLSEATLLAAQDLGMLQVLGMASLESPLSEDLAPLESSLRRVNFTPPEAGLLDMAFLESPLRRFISPPEAGLLDLESPLRRFSSPPEDGLPFLEAVVA